MMEQSASQPAPNKSADVVIAGGGYVGLTLAIALTQEIGADLKIAIIERGPAVPAFIDAADPRASAISAASRNLLEALGLWQGLQEHAVPVGEIELTDSSLAAAVRRPLLSYDNHTSDGDIASWILPNAALASSLETAVARTPSIERLFGTTITRFDGGLPKAIVTLSDCARIETRLAIAADGRRSGLRDAGGIPTVAWDYDQTGIVTTISHEFDHRNRAIQHFLPGGPFALLPLKGGHRSCVTWSETAAEAKRIMALDDAAFLDEIDTRAAGRLGAVKLAGSRRSWPLEAHLARRYVSTRLALVGDAAHGVHPIGGQGLNLGLRDVAALVECLSDAVQVGLDLGDAGALTRYERWRRFDSTVSTAAYTGLNRLFSNDFALVRSAREVGLGILDRLPAVKQRLVGEAAGFGGEVPKLLQSSTTH